MRETELTVALPPAVVEVQAAADLGPRVAAPARVPPRRAPVAAEGAAAFPGVAVWWSATRADRGRDDSCDRVRVGDQCQVGSAVERGDVRACALGHRELRGGRDDLI